MRTSKPISTISYNSESFLKNKILQWKSAGIIDYAMWIRHEPEEDEKKAHYHVFIKPAQLIQTTRLENDSIEIDPQNIDKPFKMISFRSSTESDWLLYSIHDPVYLAEKGLSRQFCYGLEDVQNTCSDTFNDIVSHVSDNRKGKIEYRLLECINNDMTWQQIVSSGMIPLRYMSGAKLFYQAVKGQDFNIK